MSVGPYSLYRSDVRFEGTIDIAASRERVWAFVTDPRKVATCAPDVQGLEVDDPRHFRLIVRPGIGPFRSVFTVSVEFADLVEPEHASVVARGRAHGSAVALRGRLDLAGDGTTTLRWSSDVTLSGLIASVGSRLVQSAVDKTTRQTFDCIKAKLETP